MDVKIMKIIFININLYYSCVLFCVSLRQYYLQKHCNLGIWIWGYDKSKLAKIYLQLVYSAWIRVKKTPTKTSINVSNPGCIRLNISRQIRWGFVGGRSKNVVLSSMSALLYTSCNHDRIFLASISFSVAAPLLSSLSVPCRETVNFVSDDSWPSIPVCSSVAEIHR